MDRLKRLELEIEKLKNNKSDYQNFLEHLKLECNGDQELIQWIEDSFK